MGKPCGKRPFEKFRSRWEDNIKFRLQEMETGCMNWIDLAQEGGQVAGFCDCGNERQDSIKCGKYGVRMNLQTQPYECQSSEG